MYLRKKRKNMKYKIKIPLSQEVVTIFLQNTLPFPGFLRKIFLRQMPEKYNIPSFPRIIIIFFFGGGALLR